MEEQLKISKLYLSAFLQATIQGKKEYLAMFRNHRQVVDWLPKTLYVNRFEDSTFRKITDFEEDINPLTGSGAGVSLMGEHLAVWSEDRLEYRHGNTQENHAVRLGWKNDEKNDEKDKTEETQSTSKDTEESKPGIAKYSITLTEEFLNTQDISDNTLLVFSMTDTGEKPPEPGEEEEEDKEKNKENAEKNEKKSDEKKDDEEEEEEPLDLTLELVDANGTSTRLPLSYFSTLHPPLKVTYTKWPMMENFAYAKSSEPVLETFEFPLKAFKETNPDFAPGKLEKIIFLFDKGDEGVIYLDEIGFRQPHGMGDR
jgi:hypothetical protein